MQIVREMSIGQAVEARDSLVEKARNEIGSIKPQPPLFCEFAASLMETKILTGKIRSVAGRKKWEGG